MVTPEEKCRVFLNTHFPAPADLPDEAPDLLTQQASDIEWIDVTQAECLRVLMSTTRNTAPGEDGIPCMDMGRCGGRIAHADQQVHHDGLSPERVP